MSKIVVTIQKNLTLFGAKKNPPPQKKKTLKK